MGACGWSDDALGAQRGDALDVHAEAGHTLEHESLLHHLLFLRGGGFVLGFCQDDLRVAWREVTGCCYGAGTGYVVARQHNYDWRAAGGEVIASCVGARFATAAVIDRVHHSLCQDSSDTRGVLGDGILCQTEPGSSLGFKSFKSGWQ